jgi:hypothetical protein
MTLTSNRPMVGHLSQKKSVIDLDGQLKFNQFGRSTASYLQANLGSYPRSPPISGIFLRGKLNESNLHLSAHIFMEKQKWKKELSQLLTTNIMARLKALALGFIQKKKSLTEPSAVSEGFFFTLIRFTKKIFGGFVQELTGFQLTTI